MGLLFVVVAFVIVGLVEMLIPLFLTVLEKKILTIKYLHFFLNILFITVSLYYINFVPMYPHGPSPIWLAFPAWPSYMIFYSIIYPKILKNKKSKFFVPGISFIYLIGSLVGLFVTINT